MQSENDMDKASFFFLNGYVSRIMNQDKLFYQACPNDSCKKKVVEDMGSYRCENCNKNYDNFKPSYFMSAKISDFTDSVYVSFSNETATQLIGMTAVEFKNFKDSNDEAKVTEYLDSLMFKNLNLMIKGKLEYYNSEYKTRFFAVRAFPRNVKAENKALLKRLDVYSNMQAL